MRGASLSYELYGLVLFCTLATLPLVPGTWLGIRWIRLRLAGQRACGRRVRAAATAACLVYGGVLLDAYLVEPNAPVVSFLEVEAPLPAPLRVLHLSDLHVERVPTRRAQWLVEQVARLQPDVIVLTGDTHQLDNADAEALASILTEVRAPLGVYACVGSDDTRLLAEAAPHMTYLVNASRMLEYGNARIGVAGIIGVGDRTSVYHAINAADFRIVLNHTPDLAEEAAAAGADLYLCGHTHGGQVRIPGWGAIITNCATGKRFEAGRYQLGNTVVYTSRGLGLEPRPAPQVRFFCRPEITVIDLTPA